METKKSPSKKSPTKADVEKRNLEQTTSLEQRVQKIQQNGGDQSAVEEYRRTELIRKSINDVKDRAERQAERRESPQKAYAGVKSKIAGNMKSQKKAKKISKVVAQEAYIQAQVISGNTDVLAGTKYAFKSTSPQKRVEISPEKADKINQKESQIAGFMADVNELRQNTAYRPSITQQQPVKENNTNVNLLTEEDTKSQKEEKAAYKSAYAQNKSHIRKIASAKKKLSSFKSNGTAVGSGSFIETPYGAGATPAGVGLDDGFGISSAKVTKNVQKQMTAAKVDVAKENTSSPRERYQRSLNQFRVGSGADPANMFRNEEYEAKIAAVQAEFNALLTQKASSISYKARDDLGMDTFYQVMGEFYDTSNNRKHESPTRRLMDQQANAWQSKAHLYKKMKQGEISKNDYAITYVVDPHSAYVIQPKEGEIDYDVAKRDPNKFYDTVMNQDVVEHKVAKKTRTKFVKKTDGDGELHQVRTTCYGMQMETRVTKRAVARILIAVQNKLHSLLVNQIIGDEHDPSDVREALEHPSAKDVIQRYIMSEGIKLVEPTSQVVVYKQQMHLIGSEGDRAANASPSRFKDADDQIDPEDAHLIADESAIKEVAKTVGNIVKQKTLEKQSSTNI